jgi:serine/threonine protein kinase
MESNLKNGVTLKSDSGSEYKVIKLLGAGGQGEVYEVAQSVRKCALKWYFKHTATPTQKAIIENLITKGAPDETFLWPQDIVDLTSRGEPFGYVMALRPNNYKGIVDMMKRRAEPSFYALCRAAFNLTQGYEKLHRMGYSYRDISFGNLFFNPENGDILICDNDNVSVNSQDDSAIYGTPRFMAPEIVVGKAKPSRNTDLYSLAVLLFYMFMMHHPLEGKLEANIKCLDIHAMNRLYGTDPVFIFDPENKTNRPLKGYQDNADIYWNVYPQSVRDLFTQSFTVGLGQPNRRVTERQWLDLFANLMSGILICPDCGSEVFYDEEKVNMHVGHVCWQCGNGVDVPPSILIGKNKVLITGQTKFYAHHIYGDYDMNSEVAGVVQNPNNPALWGIKNMSKENWTYIKADGTQISVPFGKTAAIAKDAKIDFGRLTGEFC